MHQIILKFINYLLFMNLGPQFGEVRCSLYTQWVIHTVYTQYALHTRVEALISGTPAINVRLATKVKNLFVLKSSIMND